MATREILPPRRRHVHAFGHGDGGRLRLAAIGYPGAVADLAQGARPVQLHHHPVIGQGRPVQERVLGEGVDVVDHALGRRVLLVCQLPPAAVQERESEAEIGRGFDHRVAGGFEHYQHPAEVVVRGPARVGAAGDRHPCPPCQRQGEHVHVAVHLGPVDEAHYGWERVGPRRFGVVAQQPVHPRPHDLRP